MSKMIGPDYDAAKSKAFYEGFNEIQPFNLEDRINAAIEKAYMRGFYDGVEFVEKRHGMEVSDQLKEAQKAANDLMVTILESIK